MGFGTSIRKAGKRIGKASRRAAKRALKRSWKTTTAASHLVSEKALGGRFDPWTQQGRLEAGVATATLAAAVATGGAAAGIAGAAGTFLPAAFGGGGVGLSPDLASGSFDATNAPPDVVARLNAPNWQTPAAIVLLLVAAWKLAT